MTNRRFSSWAPIIILVGLAGPSSFSASEPRPSSVLVYASGPGLAHTSVPGSAPSRISSQILDLGQVHAVHMSVGMVTLIQIPNAVTGIRIGNPDAVQYFRPDKPENEVTLVLKDASAKPTNLIIRSGKRIYVFDIVPSTTLHQDLIEVMGDYGGPASEDAHAELIESSSGAQSARSLK